MSAAGLLALEQNSVLSLVLEATSTGIWTWDVNTDVVRWSPETYGIHGLGFDEFGGTGAAFFEYVHPDDRERVRDAVLNAITAHQVYCAEFRIVRPDGSVRWVMNRGRATYEPDGKPATVLGTITDITGYRSPSHTHHATQSDGARTRPPLKNAQPWQGDLHAGDTEAALVPAPAWAGGTLHDDLSVLDKAREIELLYQHAPVGLCVLDRDLRYQRINERLAEINGLAAADHIGRHVRDVVPDLADAAEAALQRVVSTGLPLTDIEIVGTTPAQPGVVRTWVEQWYPLKDASGVIAGVHIVAQEVTEQRRLQAELHALADTMPQMVWSTRPDGFHDYYNARWYEFTGVPEGSTNGDAWNGLFHPEDQQRAWEQWRASLASGQPYEIQYRLRHRSGTYRWVLGRALPLKDAQGRILRWCGTCTDIDDARRAADRLQASERRRSIALTAGRMAAWEYDVVSGENSWDERLPNLIRWPASAAADWLRTIDPRDKARVEQEFADAIAGKSAYASEFRIVGADGGLRWFSSTAQSVRDETGRVARLIGILQDVTERKQAELDRERDRVLIDTVLASIPAGVVISDAQGRLIRWNAGTARLWGTSPAQPGSITGVAAFALCKGWRFPDGKPLEAHDWPIARSLERLERVDGELIEIEPFDGSARRVALFMSAPLLSQGELIGSVSVQTDVTAQVRSEQALEAMHARLKEATWAARLGIFECDATKDTLVWDARIREWWGLTPDEPLTVEKFMRGIHPEDREGIQAAMARAYDSAGDGRYDATYRVVHPDGTVRWMHATGQVTFKQGATPRLVGTLRDISEAKALTERLLSADRQKDRFIATLSHELRNPLAPIRTAAQILSSTELKPEQLQWARSVIQRQVAHMSLLLDDLLDVARVTQGKLALRLEPVRLNDVINTAIEAVRPLIDKKGHVLSVNSPEAPIVVDIDRVRVAQIITNLLNNAAKYSDPGTAITLSAAAQGHRIEVSVHDNGIGIDPAVLPTLFEMFTQVEDSRYRSEGGLGIGLALARALAELHGGTLEARSAGLGLGSTFTLLLPLSQHHVPRVGEPVEAHVPPGGTLIRVLVVDDNIDAADSIAVLLRLWGHEVAVAYDGAAALEAAARMRPDIALLDIGLPQINGFELAARLRQESWGSELRLVALSGWGQEVDRVRSMSAGFSHHLTKPVDIQALKRILVTNLS